MYIHFAQMTTVYGPRSRATGRLSHASPPRRARVLALAATTRVRANTRKRFPPHHQFQSTSMLSQTRLITGTGAAIAVAIAADSSPSLSLVTSRTRRVNGRTNDNKTARDKERARKRRREKGRERARARERTSEKERETGDMRVYSG